MSTLFNIVCESLDEREKAIYKKARKGYLASTGKGALVGAGVGAGLGAAGTAAFGTGDDLTKKEIIGTAAGIGSLGGASYGLSSALHHNAGAKDAIKGKAMKNATAKYAIGYGLTDAAMQALKNHMNKKAGIKNPNATRNVIVSGLGGAIGGAMMGRQYDKGVKAARKAMEEEG